MKKMIILTSVISSLVLTTVAQARDSISIASRVRPLVSWSLQRA